MDYHKKYYRIVGMPIAMQVWFYECCSKVDPKIAKRFGNRVPRLLNWRTTVNRPTYAYLVNGMFKDQGNMIPLGGVEVDTSPTNTHSDNYADDSDDSDDFNLTSHLQPEKNYDASVVPSSSPPHKKHKEHILDHSEAETKPKTIDAGISEFNQNVLHDKKPADSKADEVSSLRNDLNSFKDYIKANQPTVTHDNGIQMSHDVDVQYNPKGQPKSDITVGENLENTDVNHVCDEAIVDGNNTSEMLCIIPPIYVSKEVHVSQFELSDKFLPSQIPEARIVIHHAAKNPADATSLASHRNRHPSRWYSSPYELNFDSAGTSVKLTPIFDKKHPFENDLISGPHPTLVIQEYEKWIRDGFLAKHYQKYADTDSNANVAKEEDVVYEYIRGYRLLANVLWHTIDNVLIPVNLKKKLHWVLAVVSFKDRCIKVDCGVHDAVYVEFLSTVGLVPQTKFDANLLRQRYGVLLWDYTMRKIDVDVVSESEAPSKILRHITDSDTSVKIMLE
ncbi:uncharacterized protein [Nicotiana sylvestris]|uniref:uncharacterized protein n=1 Tax=Nicotiana sylvestris TaxID=4096 RepID=UPI00388C8BC3